MFGFRVFGVGGLGLGFGVRCVCVCVTCIHVCVCVCFVSSMFRELGVRVRELES